MSLLHIENLNVSLRRDRWTLLPVLENFSLRMNVGESLGVVGESGSGKSMLALAIMGLLSQGMEMRADYMNLDGQDLMKMSAIDRQVYIASKAAIIFQEPKQSLNPCFTVAWQIIETLSFHGIHGRSEQQHRLHELLFNVGIRQPEIVAKMYPHQLSGGMSQRIAIAIALASSPKLLIADEPTTALDVTIQSQILKLLQKLNKREQLGLMLITHDFSLIGQNTDKTAVVYSGQLVEHASTVNILENPLHPYTKALIDSIPQMGQRHQKGSRLFALGGQIPSMEHLPVGCRLGPRCPRAERQCVNSPKLISVPNHGKVRCHLVAKTPGAQA